MSAVNKDRPQFRNIGVAQLVRYRMPLSSIVSILHRISGLLIFLLLPFVLYLLEESLTSEISFEHFKGVLSHWFAKLVVLALAWAYLHHFCAGIRHLFMDGHFALTKDGTRRTAVTTLVISLLLTALVAARLFGAF